VEQTVEGEDGIEGTGRKVEVQEVHDVGVQPFEAGQPHHFRREVGHDDVDALVAEPGGKVAWSAADLQQGALLLGVQKGQEGGAFGELPRPETGRVALGSRAVVGPAQGIDHGLVHGRKYNMS
jgi:hypothetical protein